MERVSFFYQELVFLYFEWILLPRATKSVHCFSRAILVSTSPTSCVALPANRAMCNCRFLGRQFRWEYIQAGLLSCCNRKMQCIHYINRAWNYIKPLVLALVPLQQFTLDFKIFQWKCPLQNKNGLALSNLKFQAWSIVWSFCMEGLETADFPLYHRSWSSELWLYMNILCMTPQMPLLYVLAEHVGVVLELKNFPILCLRQTLQQCILRIKN